MKPIDLNEVQEQIDAFAGKKVFIHLETTNGAYANHVNEKAYNVGAFIRNAQVTYEHGKIKGAGAAYRVGLKTENGWVYAEGLNAWELDDKNRLLMAGHDREGRLMVSLEISETAF